MIYKAVGQMARTCNTQTLIELILHLNLCPVCRMVLSKLSKCLCGFHNGVGQEAQRNSLTSTLLHRGCLSKRAACSLYVLL